MTSASLDAPILFMTEEPEKIVYYTKGQIGKKHKVSLSKVTEWLSKMCEEFGYQKVEVWIEDDPYGGEGFLKK